jgi:succinate dehydrogenase/fumarate reductase flavoprotein subunit
VHPTGLVNPADPSNLSKFLGPEALRGCGGIMLNQDGRRFVDELGTREYVTQEIFAKCKPLPGAKLASGADQIVSFTVMNEEAAQSFGKAMLSFYLNKGFFKMYSSAKAFAEEQNIDPAVVEETLVKYSASAAAGKDEFGKTCFPVKRYNPDQTLYVCITTPVIHYTMGGLKINSSAEVCLKSCTVDITHFVIR